MIASDAVFVAHTRAERGERDGGYERRPEFFTSSRCDCGEQISRVPDREFTFTIRRACDTMLTTS